MSNEESKNVRTELYMAIDAIVSVSELNDVDFEETAANIVHDLLKFDEILRDRLSKLSIKLKNVEEDGFSPDITLGIRFNTDEGILAEHHEIFEP